VTRALGESRGWYELPTGAVEVHRIDTSSAGDHFYTADAGEADGLWGAPGRRVEYAYFYLSPVDGPNLELLYRCLTSSGRHLYTTSASCENSGAAREGALGYLSNVPTSETTPLRRLYNPSTGDHAYTVRRAERDALIASGYRDEGISGHVWVPTTCITPVIDGSLANLQDMRAALAPNGDGPNVRLGASLDAWYLSWAATGPDYGYDPSDLGAKLNNAVTVGLPVVVNLNGGRWATAAAVGDFLSASVPLWGFRNALGEPFFTANADERRQVEAAGGQTYAGVVGGIFSRQIPGTIPLYRNYRASPSDRLYTSSLAECEVTGYRCEGVAGYVLPSGNPPFGGTANPLFRLYHPATGKHMFTPDPSERAALLASGWVDEGVAAFLPDPWVSLDQADYSLFDYGFGKQFISLSRLNTVHHAYKSRNLKAASDQVEAFRLAHPGLYCGVTLDSETLLSDDERRIGDYNPMAIREWRQWLAGTGLYAPGGPYYAWRRMPAWSSIGAFNQAMGTHFASFNEVAPPRVRADADPFWKEWRRFSVQLVNDATEDMANWIRSRGLPEGTIFGHQTPAISPTIWGDDFVTAEMFGRTTVGITTYGGYARSGSAAIAEARQFGRHLGIPEWNPSDGSTAPPADVTYQGLEWLYVHTARVVSPYAWLESNFPFLALRGTTAAQGIASFISQYAAGDR
jgi:hypothetical protein